MANEIDERIVEMQFDNKQFRDGVQTTLKDLDDLKKGLKFDETVSGFERLDKAASNVNLNPLQNGIEVVQQRFSALEVIAISALSRITNQAMAAGESLLKSFTVDPMRGFEQYESKVASVQKIINSAAENNIENVTAMLNKIEWFTNETSYQFDAMVSTLGSFSAAGIPLEQATNTIVGLANAAAISGVNAKDASHAFLGFQRAIGSGSLSLGIWNSYLKTAGFQSQAFIEAAIKAGLEVGTLTGTLKDAKTAAKGTTVELATFGETLNEKWLNADVIKKLSENFSVATNQLYDAYTEFDGKKTTISLIDEMADSLDEYSLKAFKAGQETKTWSDAVEYVKGTIAQTWSKTFELIFGNYEEATKFYSALVEDMYTIFVEANDNRNTFLAGWKEAGQVPFLNGLINSLKIVAHFVHLVNEGVANFVENSGLASFLTSLSLGFHSLTVRLGESLGVKDLATSIDEIAESAKDVLGIEDEAVDKVKDGIEAAKEVKEVVGDVAELASKVIRGDFGNGSARRTALEALGHSYEAVQNKVNELLGCSFRYRDAEGKEITMDQALAASKVEVEEAISGVNEETEKTEGSFNNLKSTFSGVIAILRIFGNAVSAVVRVGSRVVSYIFKFGEGVVGLTGSLGDLLTSIADYIDKNDLIFKGINSVADAIADFLAPALEKFVDLMDSLANRTNPFIQKLEEMRGNIENFAEGLNIFGSGSLFETIKSNLSNAFGNLREDITWLVSKAKGFKIVETVFGGAAAAIGAIGKTYGLAASIIKGTKVDVAGNKNSIFGVIETWYNEYAPKLPSFNKMWTNFWNSLKPKEGLYAMYEKFKKKGLQGILPTEGFLFGNISQFEKDYKTYKLFFDELFLDLKATSPLFDTLTGSATNIVGVFKDLSKVTVDLAKSGFEKLTVLLTPLADLLSVVTAKIASLPYERILRLLTVVGSFIIVYKGVEAIKLLTTTLNNFASIGKNVSGAFKTVGDAISGFFNSLSKKTYATIALSIAASIGIIAAAVYALGTMETAQLVQGGVVIAVIGGILAGLIFLISKMAKQDNKSMLIAVGSLVAIVAAIAGLIAAMYYVMSIPSEQYEAAWGRMAQLFIALLGAMLILSKLGKDKTIDWKTMAALYVFVMSLGKVMTVIKELSEMPIPDMLKGIFGLYAVAGALVILAGGLDGLKFNNSLGLAALVGAVWMFVQLLKIIAQEDIFVMVTGLLKLIPALIGILALAKIGSMGADFKGFAAMLLSLALSMKIIGEVIADLGALGIGRLVKGGIAAALIMLAITKITEYMTMSSKRLLLFGKGAGTDMAKMFLAISASLFIIAAAIQMLANLDTVKALAAAAALAGIVISIGFALRLAQDPFGGAGSAKILAFAIVIGAICAAVMLISLIPFDELWPAAVSLGGIIIAVGIALVGVGKMDLKTALSAATALTITLAAVVAALLVLAYFGEAEDTLKNAEAIALIVGVLGTLFGVLAGLKIHGFIMVAAELAAAIDAFALIIGSVAYAAGALVDAEILERGLNIFVTFFERIGEMAGGLLGGVIKGFTDPLPQAGKNLSDFATNVQKFVDTFINNDWIKIAASIMSFSEAMKSLKKVGLNGYDFTGYAAAMSSLATGFATFDDIITKTNVKVEKAKTASEAIQILAEVLSDPIIFDSTKWANFGTAIESLANSIVNFNKIIAPEDAFDPDRINRFVTIFNRIVTMAERMGSLEGFQGFGILMGEEVDGVDGLGRLARSIVNFNKEIGMVETEEGALNIERVGLVIELVKRLAEAAKLVPLAKSMAGDFEFGGNIGSVGAFLKLGGETDQEGFSWNTLSTGLSGLAGALVAFAKNAETLDMSQNGGFEKGMTAVERLTQVASSLPTTVAGAAEKFFLGDNTLNGFAMSLSALGEGLLGFYNNTKDLDSEKLGPSLEMINTILGLPKAFEDSGLTSNDAGMGVSLSTWGSNLVTFAERFVSALTILDDYAADHMDEDGGFSITKTIGGLFESLSSMWQPGTAENLQNIGTEIATAIATGLETDNDIVRSAARTLGGFIREGIFGEGEGTEAGSDKFIKTGEEVAKLISDGVYDKVSKAKAEEQAKLLRGTMALQFSSKEAYDMFYRGGENLANGLIAGFKSKQAEAVAAAISMGVAMNDAFTSLEDQHSPSKVWFGYGENLINGLVNGVYDMTDSAVNSVRYVAQAMNGEMASANSFRITPVVDMNGATRSANQLNTMFDASRAAALNASMEVNSQVTRIDQLVDVTNQILGSIQNGSDLYLDDRIIAGRINRRLGAV